MPQDRVLVVLVVIAVRSIQPSDGRSMAIGCAMWRGMYCHGLYKIYRRDFLHTPHHLLLKVFILLYWQKRGTRENLFISPHKIFVYDSLEQSSGIQYTVCILYNPAQPVMRSVENRTG